MNDDQKQDGNAQNQNNPAGATPPQDNQDLLLLQQELEATREQLQNLTIVSQRALADLQNFKRRTEEEKAGFIVFANAELLTALIPAIDNIHRALEHEPKDTEWIKGSEQTLNQLITTLQKIGLNTIETKQQKFDPKLHEALLTEPGEKDMIVKELEKGYIYNDKVIKRARVSVGNGENAQPAQSQQPSQPSHDQNTPSAEPTA